MRGIAYEQCLIVGTQRHARAEPAQVRNGLHLSIGGDAVDLARFAPGPQETSAIKGQTLRVIEAIRENLEALNRNLR